MGEAGTHASGNILGTMLNYQRAPTSALNDGPLVSLILTVAQMIPILPQIHRSFHFIKVHFLFRVILHYSYIRLYNPFRPPLMVPW